MGQLFKIKHPEVLQGNLSSNHYFEGWYFKLVSKDALTIWAFIVGIALDKKTKSDHVFIQFFDGLSNEVHYLQYPLEEFSYSKEKFEVKVGQNFFAADKIQLNINRDGVQLQGELIFQNLQPLPKQGIGYNIMGPFVYVPYMECRHCIVSMDQDIQGTLKLHGINHDFSGGKGYIEKDYGTSFPKAYIWGQSNHFQKESASIIVSVARIPSFGLEFVGFLCVFWWKGNFYRFTTYTHAKLSELQIQKDFVRMTIYDKKFELIIEGHKGEGTALPSPTAGNMSSRINESLKSILHVWFYKKSNKSRELLFEDEGIHAGLEIQATLKQLGF